MEDNTLVKSSFSATINADRNETKTTHKSTAAQTKN